MAGLPDNSIGVPSSAGLVPGVDIPLASALTYNLAQQQREQQQGGESEEPSASGSEETLAALQQLSNLVAHSSQGTPTQVVTQQEGYSQADQGEAYTEQEFGGWFVCEYTCSAFVNMCI